MRKHQLIYFGKFSNFLFFIFGKFFRENASKVRLRFLGNFWHTSKVRFILGNFSCQN